MQRSLENEYGISKRFDELALMISKRYNQRLTKNQKSQICKGCSSFLNSKTSKHRISPKGWKIITCLNCDTISRYKI